MSLREELKLLIGQCPSAAHLRSIYDRWYTTGESGELEEELAHAREKLSRRLHLMIRAEEELKRSQRCSKRRHETALRRYDEREANYFLVFAEVNVVEAIGLANTAFQNRNADCETLRGIATRIRVQLAHARELFGAVERQLEPEPLRLAA